MLAKQKSTFILIGAIVVGALAYVLLFRTAQLPTLWSNGPEGSAPLRVETVTTEAPVVPWMEEDPDTMPSVDMQHYTSPLGFTIAYPSTWETHEYGARPEGGFLGGWSASPPSASQEYPQLNPLISVSVYEAALDITDGLYVGEGQMREFADPDVSLGQSWIEHNGLRGIYGEGFGGVRAYDFLYEGRRYSILVNDVLIFKARLSKEAADEVVATFKITGI